MQRTTNWREGGPLTTYAPFENFFGRFNDLMRPMTFEHLPEAFRRNEWPKFDTFETDEAFYFDVDLPGLDREDVHVELVNKELRVFGERKWEKTRKNFREDDTKWTEMGRFDFTVALPPNINFNEKEIVARLDKGVLQVEVPKLEKTPTKLIEVK